MKPGLKGIVYPKMFFLLFNTYQEGEKNTMEVMATVNSLVTNLL